MSIKLEKTKAVSLFDTKNKQVIPTFTTGRVRLTNSGRFYEPASTIQDSTAARLRR
jgi:hypothetical protein